MIRYTQVGEDDVEINLKIGTETLDVIQTILIVMIFMIMFQTMISNDIYDNVSNEDAREYENNIDND